LNSDLDLALELADLADGMTMGRFRADDLAVEAKHDGSPVTDADRAVESALRARLGERRSGHAVVGEEAGGEAGAAYTWYLDPIDGTDKFAAGLAGWCTLIALANEDEVLVGVASAPSLGRRWWASRGSGAFCNGHRLATSATSRLAEATVSDDWWETLARGVDDHPLAALAASCAHVRPHDGHSDLAIADGLADIGLGVGGHVWDYAAMKIIVEEAGGRFTDLDGFDAIDSRHALVSNGRLHDEALGVLKNSPREGWTRPRERRMDSPA
jgi:histidinol-phosphatase